MEHQLFTFSPLFVFSFFIKLPKELISRVLRLRGESNRTTWRRWRVRRLLAGGLLVEKVTVQVPFVSLLLSMGMILQGLRKCLFGFDEFLFKQLNIDS